MTLFRRPQRKVPPLNTATLPDLIFVVLFFFMAVTHMREVTLRVSIQVPEGTELTKLTRKSAVTYVYVGKSVDPGGRGGGTRMQVNDKLADMETVVDYVTRERERMSPEDAQLMSVSIKADRDTEMGILADLRQALVKANIPRINYSAVKRDPGEAPAGK